MLEVDREKTTALYVSQHPFPHPTPPKNPTEVL